MQTTTRSDRRTANAPGDSRTRALATVTAAAFLHLTLWGALPALAAPPPGARKPGEKATPRVLLVKFQKAEGTSDLIVQRIQEYMTTLLAMNSRLELLDESALTKPAEEPPPELEKTSPALTKADDLLWKGKEAVEKKKYRSAIEQLIEATELYEENYKELRDYDKLVDGLLQLSLAYFRAGYDHNGEETLTKVVTLRPDVILDARLFSTGVKEAVDRIKARYAKTEAGKVRVEATAPASVYLDGVLRGMAPLSIEGLSPGFHYVQVFADGHEPFAQRFTTPKADKTMTVAAKLVAKAGPAVPEQKSAEASLVEVVAIVKSGRFVRDLPPAAKPVVETATAGFLFMGYVSKDGREYILSPFLYDAASEKTAALEEVRFDSQLTNLQVNLLVLEDHLVTALTAFPKGRIVTARPAAYDRKPETVLVEPTPPRAVEPTPVVEPTPPATTAGGPGTAVADPAAPVYDPNAPLYDPTKPVGPGPGTVDEAAWYQKWWVWTLVGAVVVGGAVTAGFLLAPEDAQPSRFSTEVRW